MNEIIGLISLFLFMVFSVLLHWLAYQRMNLQQQLITRIADETIRIYDHLKFQQKELTMLVELVEQKGKKK